MLNLARIPKTRPDIGSSTVGFHVQRDDVFPCAALAKHAVKLPFCAITESLPD